MNKAIFEYRLRESPRASRVRLKVTLQHGLEVVVPKGYEAARIPGLLERKKQWIRRALDRVEANRKYLEPKPEWRLPMEIALNAIDRVWQVQVRETMDPWVSVRENGDGCLVFLGRVQDEQAGRAALGRWLARKAHEHLVPRLDEISQRTGLRCSRVYVKCQLTRWGSCSRRKAISLNAKLLFLPLDLVDYLFIHELCHLQEPNHSWRFWSLVRHHSPECYALDRRLREGWKMVPQWTHRP